MKRNLILLSLAFILAHVTGCKKLGMEPKFGKYTPTDAMGMIHGEADPTDWTKDQIWSRTEKGLFEKEDQLDYTSLCQNMEVAVKPGFPNPSAFQFTLSFTTQQPTVAKFALVDKGLKPLAFYQEQYAIPGSHQITLDLSDKNKFLPDRMYRVYYVFYNNKKEPSYFGHGDIKVAK